MMETASAWVLTGELPFPRYGPRGANIDNKILMTGGNWYKSNIVKYLEYFTEIDIYELISFTKLVY